MWIKPILIFKNHSMETDPKKTIPKAPADSSKPREKEEESRKPEEEEEEEELSENADEQSHEIIRDHEEDASTLLPFGGE